MKIMSVKLKSVIAVGNSDIDSILATLDEYNVKATFFLLGSLGC